MLCLHGTHYQMGINYGQALKPQLTDILSILKVCISPTWLGRPVLGVL